jgi:hypothetical protein
MLQVEDMALESITTASEYLHDDADEDADDDDADHGAGHE